MTFIFKEFVSRVFASFIDSMTNSCCAPGDKYDLSCQSDYEHRFRQKAKEITINLGETRGGYHINYEYEYEYDEDNNFESKENYGQKSYGKHLSESQNRDLLLISGFFHELEQDENISFRINNIKYGIKPILDLCISYYYINNRNILNFIYLLAEHNKEQEIYPSLDHSDDEEYDDGEGGGFYGVSYVSSEAKQNNLILDNSESTYGGLYISSSSHSTSSNTKGEKYYVHITELEDSDKLSIFEDEWIVKMSGLTTTKDTMLPSSIHKQLIHEYHHKQNMIQHHQHWHHSHDNNHTTNNRQEHDDRHHHHYMNNHWPSYKKGHDIMREYQIIFKLGGSGKAGWSDSCSAIIVDETPLNHQQPSTGTILFVSLSHTFANALQLHNEDNGRHSVH